MNYVSPQTLILRDIDEAHYKFHFFSSHYTLHCIALDFHANSLDGELFHVACQVKEVFGG